MDRRENIKRILNEDLNASDETRIKKLARNEFDKAIKKHLSSSQFETKVKEEYTVLDYLFLSTTIQAGVGLTDIYPIDFYGKLVMILQQFVMIMTHVFTIYFFTI